MNHNSKKSSAEFLAMLRDGKKISLTGQIRMIMLLSIPAILAQISSIVMQYIDASMVGRLGAGDSASIGLMSSSTWLVGGLCSAVAVGFTVQIAQKVGAKRNEDARNLVKEGIGVALLFSVILVAITLPISGSLPGWLGGEPAIQKNASAYFGIYAMFLPALILNNMSTGMIQCSGNMKLPSLLHIVMCFLDVLYNALFIFPSRVISLAGIQIPVPGFGMGVRGAALGTGLAELTIMCIMLYYLLVRSEVLHIRKEEKLHYRAEDMLRAVKIAVPVALESMIMCGAYIAATMIVAPLGSVSIAANSFSVTAESLCYMPGYGIGSAATTLIGQSIGAKREDLTRRLGWLTVALGTGIMALSGALMYVIAPWMIGLLTPDPVIRELGTMVLRIEAFAEPLYGASIVANGVFRGAGDTLMPSCLNFASMWLVRIPLSSYLAPRMGLKGVWIAMCFELCVRGTIYLISLYFRKWGISLTPKKKENIVNL